MRATRRELPTHRASDDGDRGTGLGCGAAADAGRPRYRAARRIKRSAAPIRHAVEHGRSVGGPTGLHTRHRCRQPAPVLDRSCLSAHGWWNKGSCTADTATVKICLYEYYTDGSWRRKACAENTSLKPGGGSARRVPVRRDCTSTDRTSWRAHVDVDVKGQIDTGEVPYRQADVNCRYTGPDA